MMHTGVKDPINWPERDKGAEKEEAKRESPSGMDDLERQIRDSKYE